MMLQLLYQHCRVVAQASLTGFRIGHAQEVKHEQQRNCDWKQWCKSSCLSRVAAIAWQMPLFYTLSAAE